MIPLHLYINDASLGIKIDSCLNLHHSERLQDNQMSCVSKVVLSNETERTCLEPRLSIVVLTRTICNFCSQRFISKIENTKKRNLWLVLNDSHSN